MHCRAIAEWKEDSEAAARPVLVQSCPPPPDSSSYITWWSRALASPGFATPGIIIQSTLTIAAKIGEKWEKEVNFGSILFYIILSDLMKHTFLLYLIQFFIILGNKSDPNFKIKLRYCLPQKLGLFKVFPPQLIIYFLLQYLWLRNIFSPENFQLRKNLLSREFAISMNISSPEYLWLRDGRLEGVPCSVLRRRRQRCSAGEETVQKADSRRCSSW